MRLRVDEGGADAPNHLKSTSANWSLKPRTRGSISICRLHCTEGNVPGGVPSWAGHKSMLAGSEGHLSYCLASG